MPFFGLKSTFPESGILAVQRRELIIEDVHNKVVETMAANPTGQFFGF